MPAESKAQQHFFGMVDAYKRGDMPGASAAVRKAAGSISMKGAHDFAATKTQKLPKHVVSLASMNKRMSKT